MARRPPEDPVIAVAAHFDHDLDREASEVARVLDILLRCFGDERGYCSIQCIERGAQVHDSLRVSGEHMSSIIADRVSEWPARAAVFEAGVENYWKVSYHRAKPVDSSPMDARLGVNINYAMFWEGPGSQRNPAEVVDEIIDAIDLIGNCYYALVDCASNDWLRAGRYYSDPIALHPLPLSQEVEHLRWLRFGPERRRRVRGVYWGNYLGPSLAMLADPAGDLVRRFMEHRHQRITVHSQRARVLPSGAIFLSLTDDPLDVYYERAERPWTPEVQNAVLLAEQFESRGVL